MRADGPKDKRFVVDHGSLVYCKCRDGRFPYLYEVSSHPLVHNTQAVKRILVYIIDTDPAALKTLADWEETLGIPLGPDDAMDQHGKLIIFCLLRLGDGTVIYARALNCPRHPDTGLQVPEFDVVNCWGFAGKWLLNPSYIEELYAVQKVILGKPEAMT
ncbi:hypothetical protein K443DRAFT_116799 [Laccaria amethystina LaAM-08-1]|uniref:Uncharacterized protein n=1 Tax=Laccaria amethystina LaAM-08-1 TaxID=1095629 RepID=A0A0C9X149_9AGAR|nr:hypothetical protein K443DRAFT_116799 [Laccaria amethystina LaAM-08-1]